MDAPLDRIRPVALSLFAILLAALLGGVSDARAADAAKGGTTALPFKCEQDLSDPLPICKCEGGPGSPSCQAMKRSGACSDRDGFTMICCDPATLECRCEAGGCKKTNEACVCDDLFPKQVRHRVREYPNHAGVGRASPAGGAPSGRLPTTSGHSIIQMSGREASPPKGAPGATATGRLARTPGQSARPMRSLQMLEAGRPGVVLDPAACSCWDGIGSCTVAANRCAATPGPLGCTGTCATEDPEGQTAGYIEQQNLLRATQPCAPQKAAPIGPPKPPGRKKPGFIWVDGHWERERAK